MSEAGGGSMWVTVLGPIGVTVDAEVALGGPTQRRTLAMLAMRANQVVSIDQLVEGMWADGDAPGRAEHNLRTVSLTIFGELVVRDADLNLVAGPVAAHSGARSGGKAVALTADARYIVTDGDDGAKLWDAATLEQIGGIFPNEAPLQAAELATNANLLSTIIGDDVVVWDVDVDDWFEIGCRAVNRDMTEAEWEQFGPISQPYERTCVSVVGTPNEIEG